MNKPVVISGEASETDSEDECSNYKPKKVQGAVIVGEDSESENENDASISSAVSALNLVDDETKYDSIFHQKLKESNIKLRNDLGSFCQNTIDDATKTLTNIDQQLLRSQLTIQNAVTALKSLSANSLTITSKLQSLLSSKFLANVRTS